MPRPEQTTHIDCELVDATEKARQIKTDDGIWWVPRSLIVNDEDLPDRGHSNVHIYSWFVDKEEIE